MCIIIVVAVALRKSGAHEIIKLAKQADLSSQLSPRSISGGDSIFLPLIEKDFPEFNLEFAKSEIENNIHNIFENVNGSRAKIPNRISAFALLVVEKYQNKELCNVKIHRTAISNYVESQGTATIVFQTAFEFQYDDKKQGVITYQEKFETQYTYYFTPEAIQSNVTGSSLRCNYCGAPVTNQGAKVCEYCNNGVEVILDKVWQITNVNFK